MRGLDILFNMPQAGFLLLLLIPLLYGLFALDRFRRHQQGAYAPSAVLPYLLIPRAASLTQTKLVGWAFIWTMACIALMEPFGNIHYPASSASAGPSANNIPHFAPHEIIFLVDTSASMRVPDGPQGETRLEAAKSIMEDLLSQLRGQMVSLYAFTSELSALVPPTVDYLFVRLSIKDLHINQTDVGGTLFTPVLSALKQQAFPKPSPKHYSIIFLTDGGDNELEELKGEARKKAEEAILNAIPDPLQLHLRLFAIGLGSLKPHPIPQVVFEGKPVLSKLESAILERLAAKERGVYYNAEEWTSWDLSRELATQITNDPLIGPQETSSERQIAPIKAEDIIVDLYYQIPLGIALLFYLLNYLLPDVRKI